MSIYHTHHVNSVEDIERNRKGEIACGYQHRHRPHAGSWRVIPTEDKPEAKRVFAETTVSASDRQTIVVRYLVLVCGQHAGTIKSQMAKGGYGWRDAREVEGVTPEDVARDPGAVKEAFAQTLNHIRVLNDNAAKAAILAKARQGWDEYRAEYASVAGTVEGRRLAVLTDVKDDDYGRVFVTIAHNTRAWPLLTPAKARALAAGLIERAAEAEAITAEQVKP